MSRESDIVSHKNSHQKLMYLFIGMLSVFIVFLIASYLVSSKALKSKEDDSVLINIAGRQRMLLQKYTKEFINGLIPIQVRNSTLKTAEIAAIQISEYRRAYTKNVLEKLKGEAPEIHPSMNYSVIKGGIPLPSTFIQEVSGITSKKAHYRHELLSKWNINKDKGLRTDFEKEAFDYLCENPATSFSRFMMEEGIYTLRYATPDLAVSDECIRCHNSHEESPKNDFKLGDMMGILVLNIPIGTFSRQAEAFFESSSEEIIASENLTKTKQVFEMTLDALINGGKVPVDTNMTTYTFILPSANIEITNKLKMIKQQWAGMQEDFKKLLTVEPNSSEYAAAYTSAYNSTSSTVDTMDSIVHLMQKDSQQRLYKVKALQTFHFVGVLFCFIIVSVYLKIVRPLESHRETLEKQKEGLRLLNLELSKALDRDKRQNWLRIGLAGLNDRMRGAEDTTSLSQNIISYLAEYLNVQVGTIYLAEDNYSLCLSGSFAIKNFDSIPKEIHFGEGLIGQVAMKRKIQIITSIPHCYSEINSGLAMLSPKNLLIVPFLYENCVKGVIEFGSVHDFDNKHLDFMNQVADSIAIAINTVQSRQCLKDLLEETQAQAEKLQAGNEELINVNQELERHSSIQQMTRTKS